MKKFRVKPKVFLKRSQFLFYLILLPSLNIEVGVRSCILEFLLKVNTELLGKFWAGLSTVGRATPNFTLNSLLVNNSPDHGPILNCYKHLYSGLAFLKAVL